jgi:hypothetical protein
LWEVHPARLKQEAPQKEDSYDEGERDDDDLDESHSRFLRDVSPAPCSGSHFIGALRGMSTVYSSKQDRPGIFFSLKNTRKGRRLFHPSRIRATCAPPGIQ